mgnify:CR=1 FL=1
MIKNFKWLFLVSLTFVACNNDDEIIVEEPVSAGTANFAKYVALGDSFAAGYSDGALFIEGQKGAYPNVLSQQFAAAGGGAFTTPLMADNVGGLLLGGNVIAAQRLYFNGAAPAAVSGAPSTNVTTKVTGPFNNLGVPGAKSYHLVAAGYGNPAGVAAGLANPYYARFSTSSTSTVLADAVAQSPTFFSLWIGGNDVLGYATSGGIGVNQTGNLNPATYGSNDITDPTVFASVYNSLVSGLTTNSAKGVVANLPYVSTLPYFTTVPINPLSPSVLGGGNVAVGQATITALNAQLYGPLKQVLTAFGAGDRINLLSATVANPLLIKDESLPNLSAQLTAAFTSADIQLKQQIFLQMVDAKGQLIQGSSVQRGYERLIIATSFSGVTTGNAQVSYAMPSGGASAVLATMQGSKQKLPYAVFTITEPGEARLNVLSTIRLESVSIIRVEDVRDAKAPPMDEIKAELKQILTADENWQKAKFSEMMQKLRAKAKVQ